MRRNRKLVAVCLLAVMMLGLLSACAGSSYNDAKYTGQYNSISKLYEDATETKKVGEITNYVDAPTEQPGPSDTPTDEPTDDPSDEPDDPSDEPTDEPSDEPTDEPVEDGESVDYNTVCMSFNVLEWDTHHTGYALPADRAPWIMDTINIYDPDLLGTQEVTYGSSSTNYFDMATYLIDSLKSKYDYRTLMDEKGTPGSKVAVNNLTIGSGLIIFWKKDRFELKDSGALVYSNDNGRHFQWVKLYDKQEGITIVMTNTHMSINPGNDAAAGDQIRLGQANELYNFWDKNVEEGMAMYGTGDYNHGSSSAAYTSLNKGRFCSSRDVSNSSNANSSIDFVYINGDVQGCYKYVRCNETYEPEGMVKPDPDKRNPQYCPSDHYAIVAYCSNEYL